MGGGPRTFQGGLSKWQHKRMHEKLAQQKERGLLRHEKQLYLARLRSKIHASHLPGATTTTTTISSRSHVQALADRFLRTGAEDLWNEDDVRPAPSRSAAASTAAVGEDPTERVQ